MCILCLGRQLDLVFWHPPAIMFLSQPSCLSVSLFCVFKLGLMKTACTEITCGNVFGLGILIFLHQWWQVMLVDLSWNKQMPFSLKSALLLARSVKME